MPVIDVNIYNNGPQIEVDVKDVGLMIEVEVAGAGPAGKDGAQGPPGVDGFSPTVSTESIDGGTRVTITDKNGPKSFDVLNGQGGGGYVIGAGLKLDTGTNTLSVDTATSVEEDNTRPITSAAVFTTVGNIETLLETI